MAFFPSRIPIIIFGLPKLSRFIQTQCNRVSIQNLSYSGCHTTLQVLLLSWKNWKKKENIGNSSQQQYFLPVLTSLHIKSAFLFTLRVLRWLYFVFYPEFLIFISRKMGCRGLTLEPELCYFFRKMILFLTPFSPI